MNFDEAVQRLYSFIDYERQDTAKYDDSAYNLNAFRRFVDRFGNPQDSLRHIHVGGTDGKGSVCRMVAAVLRRAGYKVGVYTSPHLSSITERIAVNAAPIPESEFARLFAVMVPQIEGGTSDVASRSGGYATVFEILTVMAWLYFQEQQVDWVVNEVGMGGRLDATNIIIPEVCGIGPIDREHTHRLGKTLRAIAGEKLGIVKTGIPVVAGRQPASLRKLFQEVATEREAPLHWAHQRYKVEHVRTTPEGMVFHYRRARRRDLFEQRLRVVGRHQVDNALMARVMCEELAKRGDLPGDWETFIREGLETVTNPARFELFRIQNRTVILDVAHTPQALKALRQTLDDAWPGARFCFVVGALRDKNVTVFPDLLLREADSVIATRPSENPRALSAESLWKGMGGRGEVVESPRQALQKALDGPAENTIIIVVGSIYLAGTLRPELLRLAT